MKRREGHGLIFAMVLPLFSGSLADAQAVAFTPLHIYYISPTGNDANAGTSPSTAWATPHHPVQCGDVIIAAAGKLRAVYLRSEQLGRRFKLSFNERRDRWQRRYLFCHAPLRRALCDQLCSQRRSIRGVSRNQSNWAVEGFNATQNSTAAGGCFISNLEYVGNFAPHCFY